VPGALLTIYGVKIDILPYPPKFSGIPTGRLRGKQNLSVMQVLHFAEWGMVQCIILIRAFCRA
jgi:hypothetical protein